MARRAWFVRTSPVMGPGKRGEPIVRLRKPQYGVWHGLPRVWEGLKRSHDVLWNQQIGPLRSHRGFGLWIPEREALGFWERRRRGTAPLRIPATANAEVAAWLPGQGAALSAVRRRSETQVLPGSVFGFGSKGSNLNIRPEPGFGGEVNEL